MKVDGRRRPHTEETKRKISESRKGKCVGHPFWGDVEKSRRASQAQARRVVVWLPCARPGCGEAFMSSSGDLRKKYCSISCARKVDSKLGESSRGRTPAEGAGRCKWYEFPSVVIGKTVRVQGTWELRVANCLDSQGLPWRTNHNRDRFSYVDINGVERTYCPDMWQDGTYIEVKGYADLATQHKLSAVQGSGLPLKVLYWEDIKLLETELFGKPLAGVNGTPRMIRELTNGSH